MFNIQLFSYQWRRLTPEIRGKLTEIFEIPRTGRAVVVSYGNTADVQSDGYTEADLATVTLEKINNYLGIEESDFNQAFTNLINKLNDEITISREESKQDEGADTNGSSDVEAGGGIQGSAGEAEPVVGQDTGENEGKKVQRRNPVHRKSNARA